MLNDLKIIEWNINQRSGIYKEKPIPSLICEEIRYQNADIVVLTEFYRRNGWEEFITNTFEGYNVFFSMNPRDQNDILIAIKISIEIHSIHTFFSSSKNIPNFLHVDIKYGEQLISIIGLRIRTVKSKEKVNELNYVLKYIKGLMNQVIVIGDFNNNRRGTIDKIWNLNVLKKMFEDNKFMMYTPNGSSISNENAYNIDFEFPEDHIFSKDIFVELMPYNREFVKRDRLTYKWDKDFQEYKGKDKKGKAIVESIPAPYPDHAIISATLKLER